MSVTQETGKSPVWKRLLRGRSIIIVLIAVSAILLIWGTLSDPVQRVRVVDEFGKPLAGATITLGNLGGEGFVSRSEEHSNNPIQSDADGAALLAYPRLKVDSNPTKEISFRTDHPDYYVENSSHEVRSGAGLWKDLLHELENRLFLNEKSECKVVLKRGVKVTVSGYIGSSQNRVEPIYPQAGLAPNAKFQGAAYLKGNDWLKPGSTLRMTSRAVPGTNIIRLGHYSTNGLFYHSDTLSFPAEKGSNYQFNLELKPARRVTGTLDASVPRPVTNGFVMANAVAGSFARYDLGWRTWMEVKPDGSFEFNSLPPGDLELIALADGFVSEAGIQRRIKQGSPFSTRAPQVFSLQDTSTTVTLRMEAAATCEIHVTDENGSPIENARVLMRSGVNWSSGPGMDFGYRGTKDDDNFRIAAGEKQSPAYGSAYIAHSDKQGRAVVTTLPSGTHFVQITHEKFATPQVPNPNGRGSNYPTVVLISGKTNEVTLILKPKTSPTP